MAIAAGVEGTDEGAVVGPLPVGNENAGGGKRDAAGMAGSCIPLSAPGGEVPGVGALEASGEAVPGPFLLLL